LAEEKTEAAKGKLGFDIKIILIGLVIFLAAMGSTYFIMKSVMAPLMPKEEEKSAEEVVSGGIIDVGEFTTNISDVAGNRYLRMEVSIEISDKKQEEKAKEFMPVIRDSVLSIIAAKTVADLDRRNWYNLKEEIKNDLNAKLGKNYVKNVYFNNFIMQ